MSQGIEQSGKIAIGTLMCEVLGTLAFMIRDDDTPLKTAEGPWITAEITYQGPINGRLRLWTTRAFANELAANLLGIDTNDPEAEDAINDAVREFMNVVCGQLVTAWYGSEAIFNLGIPAAWSLVELPAEVTNDANVTRLSVSGQPLLVVHEATPTA